MKYNSRLILRSFRKNEIHTISEFIFKLKIEILKLVAQNLINAKNKLLSKILLVIFHDSNMSINNKREILLTSINVNYFYSDIYQNKNISNFVFNRSVLNIGLFYNFLYDYILLDFVIEYISKYKIKSFSHMPKRRKHFTVQRSPHTDKKSREQFVLDLYSKSINDKHGVLYNIIKYTNLLAHNSCQIIYKKYNKIN